MKNNEKGRSLSPRTSLSLTGYEGKNEPENQHSVKFCLRFRVIGGIATDPNLRPDFDIADLDKEVPEHWLDREPATDADVQAMYWFKRVYGTGDISDKEYRAFEKWFSESEIHQAVFRELLGTGTE